MKEWIVNVLDWFEEKQILRVFVVYALCNFLLVIVWTQVQQILDLNLSLKPALSEPIKVPTWFFPFFTIALLPVTLLLENLGFRLLPDLSFSLSGFKQKCDPKLYAGIYIVVSAGFHSVLHQFNITQADPLGRLAYFLIQSFAGSYLAWIYISKGFKACYLIHLTWDNFLIFLTLVQVAFI